MHQPPPSAAQLGTECRSGLLISRWACLTVVSALLLDQEDVAVDLLVAGVTLNVKLASGNDQGNNVLQKEGGAKEIFEVVEGLD